jgi:hypothetical protein
VTEILPRLLVRDAEPEGNGFRIVAGIEDTLTGPRRFRARCTRTDHGTPELPVWTGPARSTLRNAEDDLTAHKRAQHSPTFERKVGGMTVAVDGSLCIVLLSRGVATTVTDVDALKAALDDAREFVKAREAEADVERRRAVHNVRRQPAKRCEALARKGTGIGACDQPLDERGYCPRPNDHIEE